MNLVLLESADARVFRAGTPQAEHLLRVLKVSAGSSFWCGVKNGARGIASVSEVSPAGDVAFSVAWEKPADSPRLPPVRLLVGLSRPQTMKKVFAAAAEIGCARIDVFRSEKGDPAYAESSLWRRGDGTLASILEKRPAMRSENRLFLTYSLHFYSRNSLPKQQSAEKDKRHHGQWIMRRLRLSLILFPRFHLALVVPHDH